LSIADDVKVMGPGAGFLTIDAGGSSRVLAVNGVDAVISGVTLTGGNSASNGGGIYSNGNLTLVDSRVVGNTALNAGGGIYSYDSYGNKSLRIVRSEISENTVTASGGDGAGIASYRYYAGVTGGVLEILNSTISGNDATGAGSTGGGLYVEIYGAPFASTIVNSTITDNTAVSGGGLYSTTPYGSYGYQPNVLLRNTIVADNFNLSSAVNEIGGLSLNTASSHNLLRTGQSGGLTNTNGNILLGASESARLGTLAFNGGQTRTHALRYDSKAIDAGDDYFATLYDLDFDQRGWDRIEDSAYDLGGAGYGIDIGALELAVSEYYP
jgi:hypothetical protein